MDETGSSVLVRAGDSLSIAYELGEQWLERRPNVTIPKCAEFTGDMIAVTHETEWDGKSDPGARPMQLKGAEALQLYFLQIERNLATLAHQMARLQSLLAERQELLDTLAADQHEHEECSRGPH